MPRIEVDSDQLSALAGRLLQVKQVLAASDNNASVYGDVTGSADLADSLGNFVRGWAEGCQQICDGIDNCRTDLAGAATAYGNEEQSLAHALTSRQGPTGG